MHWREQWFDSESNPKAPVQVPCSSPEVFQKYHKVLLCYCGWRQACTACVLVSGGQIWPPVQSVLRNFVLTCTNYHVGLGRIGSNGVPGQGGRVAGQPIGGLVPGGYGTRIWHLGQILIAIPVWPSIVSCCTNLHHLLRWHFWLLLLYSGLWAFIPFALYYVAASTHPTPDTTQGSQLAYSSTG